MNQRTDLAALAFTGRDAAQFLHNQLTQDVLKLAPGEACFASLCQPKGRVIALLMVGAIDDGCVVLCRSSLAPGLEAHLRRFIFRDQVRIERLEAACLSGPAPGADSAPASAPTSGPPGGVFEPLPGFRYRVVPSSAAIDDLDPAPSDPANEESAPSDRADLEAEQARELERGIAWLDPETSEEFLPQMLGHEAIGALNFRKGCFPGQEIIARTRYLGKLKRHPWTGVLPEPLGVAVLGEVQLTGASQAADAVLIEQRRRADGQVQALLVARRPEAFDVEKAVIEGRETPARGRWLNDD